MDLVKITYYRHDKEDEVKTAVVTSKQARDIDRILPHIHVINISKAPKGSHRNYTLL